MVVLAGPGATTEVLVNHLATVGIPCTLIEEQPPSRTRLARRRARRVGWPTVLSQVAFITVVQPVLRRQGRKRIQRILAEFGLDATPFPHRRTVSSVNSQETKALLRQLRPEVVVVSGTRIISPAVLESISAPFINTHAGITPRYRGVHGGYWALVEGRPDLVGTTVHRVDRGIDTGEVLGQAVFTVGPSDSIATYPYLHLAAGLPLLTAAITGVLTHGTAPPGVAPHDAGPSRLWLHPTVGQYLRHRIFRKVA